MRSSAPANSRLLFAALLMSALATLPADSQGHAVLESSSELRLAAPEIKLDLTSAEISVVSDSSANTVARAWYRRQGAEPAPAPVLTASLSETALIVEAREEASDGAGRLWVEITVGAEQQLVVTGTDLDITAREIQTPGVTAPRGVHYRLDSSRLDHRGGQDHSIEAHRSSIRVEGARGLLSMNTTGGTLELKTHHGEVDAITAATEITLSASGTHLDFTLDGGSLFVNGGEGKLAVAALEAVVVAEQWQGTLKLTGADSTVEARDGGILGGRSTVWEVSGSRQNVRLESLAGNVQTELHGGRLEARDLWGQLSAEARDLATLDVSGLEAPAAILLAGGSELTIREAGNVDLDFDDGLARVHGIGRLDAAGSRAELEGDTIERIGRIQLAESRIGLNLATLQHDAVLHLTGPGEVQLELKTPCILRLRESDASIIDSVSVVGCELRQPGLPASQAGEREIYGHLPPRTVTLGLHGDVQVEVNGH